MKASSASWIRGGGRSASCWPPVRRCLERSWRCPSRARRIRRARRTRLGTRLSAAVRTRPWAAVRTRERAAREGGHSGRRCGHLRCGDRRHHRRQLRADLRRRMRRRERRPPLRRVLERLRRPAERQRRRSRVLRGTVRVSVRGGVRELRRRWPWLPDGPLGDRRLQCLRGHVRRRRPALRPYVRRGDLRVRGELPPVGTHGLRRLVRRHRAASPTAAHAGGRASRRSPTRSPPAGRAAAGSRATRRIRYAAARAST